MMPLHWTSCQNRHEAILNLLLEKDAKLDPTRARRTSLGWFARFGESAIILNLLREKGFELESHGRTPLSFAASEGHEGMVKLLIQKGAELECKDVHGRKPLSYAASRGRWQKCQAVVKLLVEKGAELESKDIHGRTPLHLRVMRQW